MRFKTFESFLNNYKIVSRPSFRQETTLKGIYDVIKVRPKSINNNFSKDFVNGVT